MLADKKLSASSNDADSHADTDKEVSASKAATDKDHEHDRSSEDEDFNYSEVSEETDDEDITLNALQSRNGKKKSDPPQEYKLVNKELSDTLLKAQSDAKLYWDAVIIVLSVYQAVSIPIILSF